MALALCPAQVGVVRRPRRGEARCELLQGSEAGGWEEALDALQAWIEANDLRSVRADMAVSSRFVRFALVPWTDKRLTTVQERAWIRLQLEACNGDMDGWRMAAAPAQYGRPRVACAMPDALTERWHGLWRARELSGGALMPYFLYAWNRWYRRTGPGRLLGVSESDRIVWASHGPHGWQSLRVAAARAGAAELPVLAALEHRLLGLPGKPAAMLHAPGCPAAGTPDVSVAQGGRMDWLACTPMQEPAPLAMARLVAAA